MAELGPARSPGVSELAGIATRLVSLFSPQNPVPKRVALPLFT